MANGCSTLPKTLLSQYKAHQEGTGSVLVTGCGSPRREMTRLFLIGKKPPLKNPLHGVSQWVMVVLGQGA